MRFEVLGPLRVVRHDGSELVLRPRQRALLARLLLSPNRAVADDQLLEDTAPDPRSRGATSSLQAQISKLRAALGDSASIDRIAGGYRLTVCETDIDAWQLEQLAGEGHSALVDGRPDDALMSAESALALWRGDPLPELADTAVARSEGARLIELRAVAATNRLRALVELGRPEVALAELAPLLQQLPYDERLWSLRMLALHRAGRSADALQVFQDARRRLAEDLGLEPGLGLRTLEAQILAHDPALDAPPVPVAAVPSVPVAITARELPPVRYTRNGDVHLAYRVIGSGEIDVVWVPDYLHHLDVVWECPEYVHWLDGLASLGRLITYDKRGQGLSDRTTNVPPVADRVADLVAVLDAAGSTGAVLVGCSEGSAIAGHLAAGHPARVRALVLFGSAPSGEGFGFDPDVYVQWIEWGAQHWGTGRTLAAMAPSVADDEVAIAWYGRLERHTIGPSGIIAYGRDNANATYMEVLPRIEAPAVVLHRRDEPVPRAAARALADGIPNGRYIELEGTDHHPWFGDTDAVLAEVRSFLADVLSPAAAPR